jgi:hypothetical protein
MVAGTILIRDERPAMAPLRERLLARPAAESRFRFDAAALRRAREGDIRAVESVLERWGKLKSDQREMLAAGMCDPLARRLGVEPPHHAERRRWLEDFLAAEYRRRDRQLG